MLIGYILSAYQLAFFQVEALNRDILFDIEEDDELLSKYEMKVILLKETEEQIRQKWKMSSIVKVFGKNVSFSCLDWKL